MKGLEEVVTMIGSLPDGVQKDYFTDVISRINKGEKINALDIINGMDNDNFSVDIEALRDKEAKANKIFQEWAKK